jgi:hypothetical protein
MTFFELIVLAAIFGAGYFVGKNYKGNVASPTQKKGYASVS